MEVAFPDLWEALAPETHRISYSMSIGVLSSELMSMYLKRLTMFRLQFPAAQIFGFDQNSSPL